MKSRAWRLVAFLFLAGALNYADRAALSSVIPPLREQLGATDADIGLAGLLFLWSYGLMSPIAGMLADRFPRRRIVVLSLLLWSVTTLLTGFVQNVLSLFALRIVLGIVESFYLPAAAALIAEEHGQSTRGKAVGLHMLGLNVGVLVGAASAGLIAETYGWRLGFWLLGGLGIALAAMSRLFITDVAAPVASRTVAAPEVSVMSALRYLARVPTFHALLFTYVSAGISQWVFFSWLPLYFREAHGMNLGAAGLAGAFIYKAPTFLGTAVGGWLSDKCAIHGEKNRALLNALCFLLSAPFLFAFLTVPSLWVVTVVLGVSAFIRAAGVPNEHPLVYDVVPARYRSTAIGLMNACGTLAGGVGVWGVGVLKQSVSLGLIFGFSAGLFVLAGIVMLLTFKFQVEKDMVRAREDAPAGAASAPGLAQLRHDDKAHTT